MQWRARVFMREPHSIEELNGQITGLLARRVLARLHAQLELFGHEHRLIVQNGVDDLPHPARQKAIINSTGTVCQQHRYRMSTALVPYINSTGTVCW